MSQLPSRPSHGEGSQGGSPALGVVSRSGPSAGLPAAPHRPLVSADENCARRCSTDTGPACFEAPPAPEFPKGWMTCFVNIHFKHDWTQKENA